MHTINEIRIEDSIVMFIDHQPFVTFPVASIGHAEIINNVTALAKVANALNLPVVLTTIMAESGPQKDPIFSQLSAVFPEFKPIDRTNTNAWSDSRLVKVVKELQRRTLIMCGLWTEVCLTQSVLSATQEGFRVYFVSDCSGGLSLEAHEDAKRRMIQSGATPVSWMGVIADLCPDYTSEQYQKLYPIVLEHGGGVGVAVQYVRAQLAK
jgi:nicotinamidase-related amidase